MSGTTDKIKGRMKEAVGALTNDKRLKNEGKVDQASGAIKDSVWPSSSTTTTCGAITRASATLPRPMSFSVVVKPS
jgi:hypothetical protein